MDGMPKRTMKPREFADRYGVKLEDVREAFEAGIGESAGGEVYLDSMLAYMRAHREIENYPSLIHKTAALQARVSRLEQMLRFMVDTIGIHQLAIEYSDEELAGLIARSKLGLPALRDGHVAALIDVLLSLNDTHLRRMETVTGEEKAWRHLVLFAEDVDDRLAARTDLLHDPRFRVLRLDLAMAITHLKAHAKFAMALTDPDADPSEMMGRLCQRASKVRLPGRRSLSDIRQSVGKLLNGISTAPTPSPTPSDSPTS